MENAELARRMASLERLIFGTRDWSMPPSSGLSGPRPPREKPGAGRETETGTWPILGRPPYQGHPIGAHVYMRFAAGPTHNTKSGAW